MKTFRALGLSITIFVLGASTLSAQVGIANTIVDGNYVGGFYNGDPGTYPMYKGNNQRYSNIVKTVPDLLKRLKEAKEGEVIYLDGGGTFDMTGCHSVGIPKGVTIMSNRGSNKSKGALVFSKALNTRPLFVTLGSNIHIIGLRIQGPDSTIVNRTELARVKKQSKGRQVHNKEDEKRFNIYGIPNSQGILIKHNDAEIENCELFGWSYSSVGIDGGTANIHHNYIHHNQRTGLGYGVALMSKGSALIKANLFNYNRHAVASTGSIGTSYTASYNICLGNSTIQAHAFDVHGGKDRKDGSNIAGDSVNIHNNIFYLPEGKIAFRIRGVPRYSSQVYNNEVIITNKKSSGQSLKRSFRTNAKSSVARDNVENYINQVYGTGNLKIYNNEVRNK